MEQSFDDQEGISAPNNEYNKAFVWKCNCRLFKNYLSVRIHSQIYPWVSSFWKSDSIVHVIRFSYYDRNLLPDSHHLSHDHLCSGRTSTALQIDNTTWAHLSTVLLRLSSQDQRKVNAWKQQNERRSFLVRSDSLNRNPEKQRKRQTRSSWNT